LAFSLAGEAGVFDMLFDVVSQVAALAKMGKVLGPDVMLVVLVRIHGEWLAKVGGGENDLAAGDWMRSIILRSTPLTQITRPAADDAHNALPVARVAVPIDRHDSDAFE